MLKVFYQCSIFGIISFAGIKCSVKPKRDYGVEIIVEYGNSYKIDITKQKYTVFYMGKKPVEAKIALSEEEERNMINRYYDNKLDKLGEIAVIEDECNVMPKIYTRVIVKLGKKIQEIQIDQSCDRYSLTSKMWASRIKNFLELVQVLILNKDNIKSIPHSDAGYL